MRFVKGLRDRAIFMAVLDREFDYGPAVTVDLRAHGAMCFSEASPYGATAYF